MADQLQSEAPYKIATFDEWSPIALRYHPLQAGSIDGTDLEPHDKGIIRALRARYRPNKKVNVSHLLAYYNKLFGLLGFRLHLYLQNKCSADTTQPHVGPAQAGFETLIESRGEHDRV